MSTPGRDGTGAGAPSSVGARVRRTRAKDLPGAVSDSSMPHAASPGMSAIPTAESVVDKRPRYEVGDLIGSGAQGLVYRAWDRDLSRQVAMKVLRPEGARHAQHVWQFFAEARRTGSLEHAGIPAVYEMGSTTTGEPYFTMRLVTGRTLHDVLSDIRRKDETALRTWTLTKLVQMLQRVAHTLEYAHASELVHRDLKPGNVALGEHDEVLVLDWGLSKRIAPPKKAADPGQSALLERTLAGQLKGTPLYMAPEQARGDADHIDRRTDVFALGAMLYEFLCLVPPYEGTTVPEVLRQARKSKIQPPSARTPDREIPKALEETAMRALSGDPEARHPTAAAFAEDLQAWLDGSRERELRRKDADALLRVALQVTKKAEDLRIRAVESERAATALRMKIEPWAPASAKSEMWILEDRAVEARAQAAQADARAMELTVQALAHAPTDGTGRELLARTYLRWHREALDREDAATAEWLLKMVRFYDDGKLESEIREDVRLAVAAEREDTNVTLLRFEERARRLVARDEISTQPSPAIWEHLPRGRYLVVVRAPGGAEARIPVSLSAATRKTLIIPDMVLSNPAPGFVVVSGGPFLSGPRPGCTEITVPTFWIGELPVLLSEYAAWLDDLWRHDAEGVSAHVPWVPSHGPLLHVVDGRFVFCPAAPLAEQPLENHADLPVVGIARASAKGYAAWMAKRLGRNVDLPSEIQWEKAARGTDGRKYPWGDRFDPTFCSMGLSTAEGATLRPAGAFPADVSPYGVRDMAGNVRQWCRNDDPQDRRAATARGGAWRLGPEECTATTRWLFDPSTRSVSLGMRLVIEQ